MADLITEYEDYDSFARDRYSETLTDYGISLDEARERGLIDERKNKQLWQLLGRLGDDEVLVRLPEWLAEKKVDDAVRTTPTTFIGSISRETEDALLLEDSAAARPLIELAHKIHSLEKGVANTSLETDRHERLEKRLQALETQFYDREELPSLSDRWLPRSQLVAVVRRRE